MSHVITGYIVTGLFYETLAKMVMKNVAYDAMNQTEARYAGYLDGMKHTGEVVAWAYEAMKLRLAD